MADDQDKPQGRALFSHDEDGNVVDAWIWDELLGDDAIVMDEYSHDIADEA